MADELVRNAKQNERIRLLIEENRRKKQECNECPDSVDSTTSPSNQSSDESLHKLIDRSEVIEMSVKGADLALQEMAKYVKQLNGFTDNCLEDQESLVKYAFFEISTLRGVTLYDIQTDCFKVYKLIAIQLFNPNRPNIRHKDNIK
ncbi:unnamed protein product [Oppiella nova]|uniref:NR LBD domain-containing protein n=1 Tax=Oppiella nova TaxID=334625 RepID=A0A7R9LG70_9ACAR|nr:unnamed protein product [Oppiella nova]CAG2163359.1 unnamed protein product [Oppiella nova]